MTTAMTASTIEGIRSAIAKREMTATEVAEIALARIAGEDEKVHAFLSVDREYTLRQAARIDDMAAKGEPLPALAGVPFGIKDVLTLEGFAATAGSKILEGYRPPYTATAVKKLADAGAVFLGKLNCDEFAMGSSNENSAYGPVHNPHDLERVPGGSSGGSAAAVAAGMATATLGTDTGGSIRQPASFCGVVGVLPTYGRVSRYGLIAFASSLDRIGPFAANVRDAATVLGVIAGHDAMDATSSPRPVPDYTAELETAEQGVKGMRLGVPAEYFAEGLDAEVRAAVEGTIERLRAAGAEIRRISLPHTKYAIPTYYVIATAEASSNLARFDGVRYGLRAPQSDTLAAMYRRTRDLGFGAEVKRRILLGTYVLSHGYYDAYYKKAQQVRRLLAEDFLAAFREVDAILTPTAPTPAFKIGEKSDDPVAMYLADIYTVTASLAGICGVSVPCGKSQAGLPIGMQILGRHFDEATIFRVGQAVEKL
jgi:aspartyl-tRNA(Asn)/glutamyl-tRNA(Gln) amidotransferase subunit A